MRSGDSSGIIRLSGLYTLVGAQLSFSAANFDRPMGFMGVSSVSLSSSLLARYKGVETNEGVKCILNSGALDGVARKGVASVVSGERESFLTLTGEIGD